MISEGVFCNLTMPSACRSTRLQGLRCQDPELGPRNSPAPTTSCECQGRLPFSTLVTKMISQLDLFTFRLSKLFTSHVSKPLHNDILRPLDTDDSIVKRFSLTQWEKESIMNQYCHPSTHFVHVSSTQGSSSTTISPTMFNAIVNVNEPFDANCQ